jgi:hypothetical protein
MSGSLYDDDYIVLNNEIKYLPKKNTNEQEFAHGFGSIAEDLENRESSSL